MDGYYPDPAKRGEVRRRRAYERLRQEWYGRGRGRLENNAHDAIVRVGEVTEKVLQNACPDSETADFVALNARFAEIAGEQLSLLVKPDSLKEGVLRLKLRHPAYRELAAGSVDLLQTRLNAVFGEGVCRSIELR